MSDKSELNELELEKVTGGIEDVTPDVIVYYRDTEDGIIKPFRLGDVEFPEQRAKNWCSTNNKIYVDHEVVGSSTKTYDSQTLLNSLGNN